ncbi:MAG TPA: hypothetical protein VM571_06160 [Noviherbaspirillum sp.]|nr:hypothetical protein [Noviherbaspirillum sp.]
MSTATFGNRIVTGLLCMLLAACGGNGSNLPGTAIASNTAVSQTTATTGDASANMARLDTGSGAMQIPLVGQANATQARFNNPFGIARDVVGNLYVADRGNSTIRKITPTGQVTTLAGLAGQSGSVDGVGSVARFSFLGGLTVDMAGNLYVIDNSTVRRITQAGVVTTIAGAPGVSGDVDGPGATARFNHPLGGITTDPAGNVYVADTDNYLIRRVSPAGDVSTHAGTRGSRGTANGNTASATFIGPRGIASDSAGNLYITDWFGPPAPNIPEGSTFIRRIGIDGTVSTVAGSYGSELGPALFRDVHAIAADNTGNAYVLAAGSIVRVTPSGMLSTRAAVQDGQDLAIDAAGNLYVTTNHAVLQVAPDGSSVVIAGQPGEPGSADAP